MEDLNQRQLVLLVILVSFVTSIATGIITVSLLDYAPPIVTEKVERVIERTVEYVSPKEEEKQEEPVTEIREIVEQRIIDRGDDVIIETEKLSRPLSVLVFNREGVFRNRGVIISESMVLFPFVSDKDSVFDVKIKEREDLVEVTVLFSSVNGFSVASISSDDEEEKFLFSSVLDSTPNRGATVLHIGGDQEKEELYVGRVSWLGTDEEESLALIGTDGITSVTQGSFLVNLKGDIWGVQVSGVVGEYLPVSVVSKAIEDYSNGEESENVVFEGLEEENETDSDTPTESEESQG
jgi:hypothetical protein